MMDFRELRYVVAIAESGTISKAADTLYVAQPSLSKFLQNVERDLGVKLFERINRRMILPLRASSMYRRPTVSWR